MISLTGFNNGPQAVDRPFGDRTEIVRSPQPCLEIAWISHEALAVPYGGSAEIVRWLCDPRVFLEIRLPHVYNNFKHVKQNTA